MVQVIIAVGSNINPERNIPGAADILSREHGLLHQARVIRTAPVGFQEQDDFSNGAFLVETQLNRADFNRYLKEVELRLKRVKGPIKSGPRTIDLDIIVWDNEIVDEDFYSQDYIGLPVREIIEERAIVLKNLRTN